MLLNELDVFFAMPMFGYGLFTKASVFPLDRKSTRLNSSHAQ